MRLTKAMKNQILDAVMADVPEVDYDDQIKVIAAKEAFEQLPVELRVAMERNKDVINYLATSYNLGARVSNCHYEPSDAVKAETLPIFEARAEQYTARCNLKKELYGVFQAVTTTQKLLKMFPEFEKYIPVEMENTTNLPVTKVIGDLMNAGWPKKDES